MHYELGLSQTFTALMIIAKRIHNNTVIAITMSHPLSHPLSCSISFDQMVSVCHFVELLLMSLNVAFRGVCLRLMSCDVLRAVMDGF